VSGEVADELRRGVILLHRAKDAAYGNAWKRRGEVISILCNIARKVDRLESSLGGAPDIRGEARLDTVVDLLVYCLKYETFLADIDPAVVAHLFLDCEHLTRPYSDSSSAVEELLVRLDMTALSSCTTTVQDAMRDVIGGFADLLGCFPTNEPTREATVRLARVRALADRSVSLIAAIRQDDMKLFDAFLVQLTQGN
jgi:hypothetical protein